MAAFRQLPFWATFSGPIDRNARAAPELRPLELLDPLVVCGELIVMRSTSSASAAEPSSEYF
jgi:hypothetical protein